MKRRLWRVYFWFFLISTLGVLLFFNFAYVTGWNGAERVQEEYPLEILAIIECAGLYGYVFSKRLLTRSLWRVTFGFSLLSFAYSFAEPISDWLRGKDDQFGGATLGAIVVGFLLIYFPLWTALLRYGWKEDATWQDNLATR